MLLRSFAFALLVPGFASACTAGATDPESPESLVATSADLSAGDALPDPGALGLFHLNSRAYGGCVQTAAAGDGTSLAVRGDCGPQATAYFRPHRLANKNYTFASLKSGKCLEVLDGSQQDGAPVGLGTCNEQEDQQFRPVEIKPSVFRLQAVHSGKCLDVDSGGQTRLQQWTCHARNNQQFAIFVPPSTQVATREPNDAGQSWCFDTTEMPNGGGPLDVGGCVLPERAEAVQRFSFFKFDGGWEVRAVATGQCMTLEDSGDVNGTRVLLSPCAFTPNQRFRLDGFEIVHGIQQTGHFLASYIDKCLDYDAWSVPGSTSTVLQACDDSRKQQTFGLSNPTVLRAP